MSTDSRAQVLAGMMAVEEAARIAPDREHLDRVLAGDLRRVLPCDRIVVLHRGWMGALRLCAASDVPTVDRQGPFGLWVEQLARVLEQSPVETVVARVVEWEALPAPLRTSGNEFNLGDMLWLPLLDSRQQAIGALLLQRAAVWQPAEVVLAGHFARSLGHAVQAVRDRRPPPWYARMARRWQLGVLAGLILLAGLIPVHITALAPAEVVPADPALVTAPMDGVIAAVQVAPHTLVRAGTPLFAYEATTLTSEYTLAEQKWVLAKEKLAHAEQGAFRDPKSNAERAILQAEVALHATELSYAREMLGWSQVQADRDGVVIFNDADDWIGQPVRTGQEVMRLADPQRVVIRILLPVRDAIVLAAGAEVRLFLDTDPLSPLDATLSHAAYQAETVPEGYSAFRLEARLNPSAAIPRIGLRGTAKLFGEQVPLAFYLLRRPLATARQVLGL
jgi:hypothetical protein